MYKISILFDNREFEHDIYELIRAFYPEAEIAVSYEEKTGQIQRIFCSGWKSRSRVYNPVSK